MKNRAMTRAVELMLATSLLVFTSSVPVLAGGSLRGGGGGDHGGGGRFGGGPGGHGGGGYGGHGGYRGGYRGGYSARGGAYRGGYGGWGWGGVGLGFGLGLGLYYAALPFGYATFWGADGSPYYYADDNYYQWDGNANQYETVRPPVDVQSQAANQSLNLIVYPKNGQSAAQQASDETDCRRWAGSQSGFDPTQTATTQDPTAASSSKRSDYLRAETACLEGRSYSVN